MAKKHNIEKIEKVLSLIERGWALRKALVECKYCSKDFYEWLDDNPLNNTRYARACEKRADEIFEDILEIADDKSRDTLLVNRGGELSEEENKEWVNRSKVRIDARKWMLGKLQPKKYGDKLELGGNVDHVIKFK